MLKTSAEPSDTSRVAQASEQESPVNPQQPPRLRARLRITSDLGRPFHETFRDSPSPPRNSTSALPTDRPRMPTVDINPGIDSIVNSRTEDINHGVSILSLAPTQHSRELRDPVQWRSNPQLETLQPLLSRAPH